jgi:hypothetical protein
VTEAEAFHSVVECDWFAWGFVTGHRQVAHGSPFQPNGYNVGITSVNADMISFDETAASGIKVSIWGTVDRVTGVLQATQMSPGLNVSYDLICKPAARMF